MKEYDRKLEDLMEQDKELDKKYREELKKNKDAEEYQKRMAIKTRWYRAELFKIMKK